MELRSNQTMTALYCRLSQEDELDGDSGKNAGCAGCLLTFLTKNADGDDPLAVTHQDYGAGSFAAFAETMGIEWRGETGF